MAQDPSNLNIDLTVRPIDLRRGLPGMTPIVIPPRAKIFDTPGAPTLDIEVVKYPVPEPWYRDRSKLALAAGAAIALAAFFVFKGKKHGR